MNFCKTVKTVCRRKKSRRGISRLYHILIFFTLIFLGTPALCVAPEKIFIYFYSSEANINNFNSLKREFDKYLAGYGPYEFQAFKKRETFDEHIKDKENCLLLLSSWHFKIISKDHYLTFALTGLRDGSKFQELILVAKNTVSSIDDLVGATITSGSSREYTKNVVDEMFEKKGKKAKVKFLVVDKDMDALMSVGFGSSMAALTTRNTFNELKNINPPMYQRMKILAEGRKSLSLIVAVPKGFEEHAAEPINVIRSMPMNQDGRVNMGMLGLDGWQEPDPSDRQTLEVQ